jgi:hypothetical protein
MLITLDSGRFWSHPLDDDTPPLGFALRETLAGLRNSLSFFRNVHQFVLEDPSVVFAELFFHELDFAAGQGEKSVVFAHADVCSREKLGSALANDDAAGFGNLTAENLYTESFGLRIPSVTGGTTCFFMCHSLIKLCSVVILLKIFWQCKLKWAFCSWLCRWSIVLRVVLGYNIRIFSFMNPDETQDQTIRQCAGDHARTWSVHFTERNDDAAFGPGGRHFDPAVC